MRAAAVSRLRVHDLISGICYLPEGLARKAVGFFLLLVIICLTSGGVLSQDAAKFVGGLLDDRTPRGFETYVVQLDDTLYSIGKRYHTNAQTLRSLNNVADSELLALGQTLLVPQLDDNLVKPYEIKLGYTLYRIARRYGTSVAVLRSLNGIGADGVIMAGRTLLLPKTAEPTFREDFAFGISAFADPGNAGVIGRQVARLGVNWVKLEVSWAAIEPIESRYNFAALDATIAELDKQGVQILLNVYDAPTWTRETYTATLSKSLRMNTGPPEKPEDFGKFISTLTKRYVGVVDAFEVWKAPNLLKYWTAPAYDQPAQVLLDDDFGLPDRIEIGAVHYLELLRVAYHAIKTVDSDVLVITGGLAPVGFSDNYNAIETGTFLQNMLLAGAADYSDGIGAIFGASGVPPTLFCCERPAGVDSHYESYFQYFREILYLYDHILTRNNATRLPIYVTQVGWGTTEGANLAIPAGGLEWLRYTNEAEQAAYLIQAYELATRLKYIKGMFLYNLNGCAVGDQEGCFFSLIDAEAAKRPAFEAFHTVQKSALQS